MIKIVQRSYNLFAKTFVTVSHFREPELLTGKGALKKLPAVILNCGCKKPFIVTDSFLSTTKAFIDFEDSLKSENIDHTVFCDVSPNPKVKDVEKAADVFRANGCDSVIAYGGGSSMDCAKVAAALVSCDKNTIKNMRGYLKVKGKLIKIFAVPTTSGTGSETTIAAVVTDSDKGDKFSISDPKLIPSYAVLDPELTVSLPKGLTASTGMDALTHAVEAYIGVGGNKFTNTQAKKATKLIFENLYKVYCDGSDIKARENMAFASYYAGESFTRAYVGYVHAMAHSLGGFYNVPHGFANAVILPYLLEFYGDKINKKLASLALCANLGKETESEKELASKFIAAVKELNRKMEIPTTIKELKKEDIPKLARHAIKEGNPSYPVPVIMNEKQCEALFEKLLQK